QAGGFYPAPPPLSRPPASAPDALAGQPPVEGQRSAAMSDQDAENAARRAEIAARLKAEYDRVKAWARRLFGSGWAPSCRRFLLDKADEERCRRAGGRAPGFVAWRRPRRNPVS